MYTYYIHVCIHMHAYFCRTHHEKIRRCAEGLSSRIRISCFRAGLVWCPDILENPRPHFRIGNPSQNQKNRKNSLAWCCPPHKRQR